MRGSPERDISSLRAFGPGGGQIWRVVHVSACAPFGVLGEIGVWLTQNDTLGGKLASGLRETILFDKNSIWLTRNYTF